MTFRLTTILYVFALLASAMAVFGGWGIVVAAAVIAFWSIMLTSTSEGRENFIKLLVILGAIAVFVALLMPAVQSSRRPAPGAACMNNLMQIARALQLYEQTHGEKPQAKIKHKSGTTHSWRIAILPHLDQQALYSRYCFDEPWDSTNNGRLTNQPMDCFQCPSDPVFNGPLQANYFAIVSEETPWPKAGSGSLGQIIDDPSQTILLMEVAGWATPWTKPKDLTFEEAIEILTGEKPGAIAHIYPPPFGFYKQPALAGAVLNVAMVDGTVQGLNLPLPRELAIALLTANGGEEIDDELLTRFDEPQLDYPKIYAFAVFVILALLPAWRLMRQPRDAPET